MQRFRTRARSKPIRYPEGCAAPGEVRCQCNTQGPLSKLARTPSPRKINVTSKSPVGDISVVTLIRTDTTLDHSQKAEKVCMQSVGLGFQAYSRDKACECQLEADASRREPIAGCWNTFRRDVLAWGVLPHFLLGRGPHKNCKNDLDDQT